MDDGDWKWCETCGVNRHSTARDTDDTCVVCKCRAAAARAERLDDGLSRILQWCDAYPADVFPDQDMKRANEVLWSAHISMSALHGSWARRIVSGIGAIARAAIADQEEQPAGVPADGGAT